MRQYDQSKRRRNGEKPPLTARMLEELALSYAARYASSQAKLLRYLTRKLRERGWEGDAEPDLADLVSKLAGYGYVDDESYARMKSTDLLRRGYGARRVSEALGQAGIAADLRDAMAPDKARARHAALAMARKRRFGPFAVQPQDMALRQKQLAAMLRAGHAMDESRTLLNLPSENAALEWASEWDDDA